MRDITTILNGIPAAPLRVNINYRLIPAFAFPRDDIGAAEFNACLRYAYKLPYSVKRTPSGGVSTSFENLKIPGYDVKATTTGIELVLIERFMRRIQFRQVNRDDERKYYGRESFIKFKEVLQRTGIDLNKYAIDNGAEVKTQIPAPHIKLLREEFADYTFTAHHIDIRSSHMAGMGKAYPFLMPAITELYLKRKIPEYATIYKHVLTHTWGFLQSRYAGYKWAHFSKAGIEYTNKTVESLVDRLRAANRMPILLNTDGIWYTGDVYHGDGEGDNIGDWHNDHVNCTFRAKSKGAYEYIEDGRYYPVVRGSTNLDKVRPRSEWVWGDIYKKEATPIAYQWDEGLGLLRSTITHEVL